ncbi:MAG: SDR family oxidoreductase [Limnohabitans sp.]|jgi:NAD(P)-dependent dehydrogenase (short-subunit alcohol dehydrogenase family)|nr:SDR family oxidoreductase [Limnohabitans sp.]
MSASSVIVVTGGASGIGAACVKHFVRRGDTVVVIDLPGAWKPERMGVPVAAVYEGDVTDDQRLRELVDIIEQKHGAVTGLINCAGILQHRLPPEQLTMTEWDRVIAVDQRGTYLASVVFGERMAKRGAGAIINIASITSTRSVPLHAYAPAKAAVLSITQCLAAEWGRSGVRVNAISPGYTLTEALQAAIDRGDRNPDDLTSQAAMGRLVDPSEIADAAGFLLSDAARAITGINLPVDAGWLAGSTWMTYGGIPPARART